MMSNTNVHPPAAEVKPERASASTTPRHRITPVLAGVNDDERDCVVCDREPHLSNEVIPMLGGHGPICENCLWHLQQADASTWLQGGVRHFHALADFLDLLSENHPEVAPKEEWDRAHARARARNALGAFGLNPGLFADESLDAIQVLLEASQRRRPEEKQCDGWDPNMDVPF